MNLSRFGDVTMTENLQLTLVNDLLEDKYSTIVKALVMMNNECCQRASSATRQSRRQPPRMRHRH